jgi:2-keto-4-pentenoate hydratase/2-oxohepta-3-ene-1,7-dioic acid hydratase in catechol pathway
VRFVRLRHRGEEIYGLVADDRIELCGGTPFGGFTATGEYLPADAAELLMPVRPSKMVAVWRNSRPLIRSLVASETRDLCYVLKPPSSFIGNGAPIVLPRASSRVIFEAELGMVVGKRCRHVGEAEASSYILGWTIVNEVTASDLIARDPSFAQHTRAKAFDSFGVFGPLVDTAFDWTKAVIRAYQNGELRQEFRSFDLVRSPYRILSELSYDMTLEPGDLIACGSSLGVQAMRAGDLIDIEIEGLGILRNPVVEDR